MGAANFYRQHNNDLLKRLKPGDLVKFDRGLYFHWAVYIGDNKVIHLTSRRAREIISYTSLFSLHKDKAEIKEDNFWDVAGKSKADLGNMEDEGWIPLKTEEIIKRARNMIGPVIYDCVNQNCEHFAKWFRYDRKESQQVDDALSIGVETVSILAGLVLEHKQ